MKEKGLKPINKRAKKIAEKEVFGMSDEDVITGMPIGCTTVFDPGCETNPNPMSPVGNCAASSRDWSNCSGPCWWPAQTPDNITAFPDYQEQCATIQKDWKNLNYVIKR